MSVKRHPVELAFQQDPRPGWYPTFSAGSQPPRFTPARRRRVCRGCHERGMPAKRRVETVGRGRAVRGPEEVVDHRRHVHARDERRDAGPWIAVRAETAQTGVNSRSPARRLTGQLRMSATAVASANPIAMPHRARASGVSRRRFRPGSRALTHRAYRRARESRGPGRGEARAAPGRPKPRRPWRGISLHARHGGTCVIRDPRDVPMLMRCRSGEHPATRPATPHTIAPNVTNPIKGGRGASEAAMSGSSRPSTTTPA